MLSDVRLEQPFAQVQIHRLTKYKNKYGKLCFRENKQKAHKAHITANRMLKAAKSNFLFVLLRSPGPKTQMQTQIVHTEFYRVRTHAITPKHMNASCGVNRAGVHCGALSAPLASESIFGDHFNKKNLETFARPFRPKFNLLLFDTVPPCISFLSPTHCSVIVGLREEGVRWIKEEKEEGNEVV